MSALADTSRFTESIPLAHTGHWIESVVYLVPIVGFALWLGATTIKDRRERRREEAEDPDPDAAA